jgi:flagella basal body P-ring formation protein FlgA
MKRRTATNRATITQLALAVASLAFCADARPAGNAAPTVESVAREALLDALTPALTARGATATITIATADARRALAPCGQMVGSVAPGAHLVGRTIVAVHCIDGATWQTYVSADVRVEAPVWQTTRALRVGDPLANGDVTLVNAAMTVADIEVAAAVARGANGHGSPARGLASLDGRMPAPLGRSVQRPVGAGRALVAADLREEGRVAVGETVRVVYFGDGFSVSSEGRTVGAADPGASVQIRLASGSVVSGTLRTDHQVELAR